ncbi:site-specific integrase [Methylotenera versatilis]|uniref:site-specific integrase n=1 Tax=Methylotenera versatilis TaxID=1055487 RepID=UPI001F3EDB51|nr:site-specific integrase [Methylotenera versatilis]
MSSSHSIYCNNVSKVQLIALKSDFEKYIHAALASSTRSSYQSDLAHFISWGGHIPSTPEIISQYLAVHADLLAPATLSRRVVSINRAHTSQNLLSPTKSDLVKATLRGIKRIVSTKQRQVEPVLKNNLLDMVAGLEGVKGYRDRALLLIGFAGAFRRSELVGLQYSDIEFVEHGLVVHLGKSKTDQQGEGRKIAIPYARGSVCPVLALKDWLKLIEISEGAVFRPVTRHGRIETSALSTQAVAIIVKERAKAIGLDASKFSGHSLRAGLVTSAAQAGVSSWKIRQQTGHKSDAMLNRYIRDAKLFIDNAVSAIL